MSLVEEGSCISMMDKFKPLTETDMRQCLKTSSIAFCSVYSMATWLGKESLNFLINPITNITSKSICLGVFPRSKEAATQ